MTIEELRQHCVDQCEKCEALYSKCSRNEEDKLTLLAHDRIYQEHRLVLDIIKDPTLVCTEEEKLALSFYGFRRE